MWYVAFDNAMFWILKILLGPQEKSQTPNELSPSAGGETLWPYVSPKEGMINIWNKTNMRTTLHPFPSMQQLVLEDQLNNMTQRWSSFLEEEWWCWCLMCASFPNPTGHGWVFFLNRQDSLRPRFSLSNPILFHVNYLILFGAERFLPGSALLIVVVIMIRKSVMVSN